MSRRSIKPNVTNEQGRDLEKISRILHDYGMILESDPQLPSIVTIISGEPVKGSWWGHPKGHAIYRVLTSFSQQPNILLTKLVNGKTTFIERKLWPPFLSIAVSKAPWQLDHLGLDSKRLFEVVTKKGEIRTDEYAKEAGVKVGDLGEAARLLEKRLLIYGIGFHTYAGSHAKQLQSWSHWMKSVNYKIDRMDLDHSVLEFSRIADRFEKEFSVRPMFPWDVQKRR